MEDNKVIKLVYTFFVGLLLAIFVGVGISTFYESPKVPQWPTELNTLGREPTPEQVKLQRDFDKKTEQHNKVMKPYNRNVSIMTLVAAVAFLVISLAYEKKIKIIADGIMLGGLFTLLYSIGRGFASEDSKYSFLTVTVGLIVVFYLGYHRFIKTHGSTTRITK